MGASDTLDVQVVYALAERQTIVKLQLPAGATVADAVERSGLKQRHAEIGSRPLACAIYGRTVTEATTLRDGDRVEILRPLLIDPKEQRRQAASRERQGRRR
jgi:putative ubiquitin-RnfH superfamily antitoxin RatB of RatAB toxin-antitoxin module